MTESTTDECQIRLMLYREWQQREGSKTDFSEVSDKINNKFGKHIINSEQVQRQFSCFEMGGSGASDKKSVFRVASAQKFGETKELCSSLLWVDSGKHCIGRFHTKDGRFAVFCNRSGGDQCSVDVYDLLKGKKRTTSFASDVINEIDGFVGGWYLIMGEGCKPGQLPQYHLLKFNYDTLSIKAHQTGHIKPGLYDFHIVPEQSGKDAFLIKGEFNFRRGHIKRGKVIMGQYGRLGKDRNDFSRDQQNIPFAERLIGNKVQGFVCATNNYENPFEFCELDLETGECTKNGVPDFEDKDKNRRIGISFYNYDYCWAGDQFYIMSRFLIAFDSTTLKWSDVKICVNTRSCTIFVDEKEEFLTIQTGDYEKFRAFHRIALRKSDTLMNLTRFEALRESKLYKNDKYLNAANQIKMLL